MYQLYYQPEGIWVGDIMPYGKEGQFYVYHQRDTRNPGPFGEPFGWALATTKDFVDYKDYGESLKRGTDEEADQFIYAGSVFETEAGFHAFYTGYNREFLKAGKTSQTLLHATSKDGITWEKSKEALEIPPQEGYDKRNWRDPFVLWDEEREEYLLILGARKGEDKRKQTGRLVHFTSKDLKKWEFKGDFWAPGIYTMFEMPEIFKMGDWWYLVYSEQASFMRKVQYFKGRTLEELKATTANDAGIWPDNREGMLDSRAFYAGKTASDGTNRYIWGWCPTRAGNDNGNVGDVEPEWAGNLVAQRLIQHEDGTLTLGVPDAIDRKYTSAQEVKVMAKDGNVTESGKTYTLAEGASVIFNRLKVHNKISFTVKASSNTDRFGISFVRGTDSKSWYSIHVNADEGKANFEKDGDNAKYLFDNKFNIPADNEYRVTIYSDQSVCVTYINDQLSFTNRIYQMQKNPWALCCYKGEITVSDIQVSTY